MTQATARHFRSAADPWKAENRTPTSSRSVARNRVRVLGAAPELVVPQAARYIQARTWRSRFGLVEGHRMRGHQGRCRAAVGLCMEER